VFLLAMVSGATDAIGFVALGGAFTSVMTGNMVLFGLGLAGHDGDQIANTASAIVCFTVGAVVGARLARSAKPDDPPWPRPVTIALVSEFVLFAAYAVGYETSGYGRPGATMQPVLLGLTAIGLGLQSSAVLRFGQSGLSTTYMTGTLTTLVARLSTGGKLRDALPSLRVLVGLIGGAVIGGVLVFYARPFAPVFQLVLLGAVLAIASGRHLRHP